MEITWGSLWQRIWKPLKTGWLIAAALTAVYIGAIQPRLRVQDFSDQIATGLSAPAGETQAAEGVVGGVPGGVVADVRGSLKTASLAVDSATESSAAPQRPRTSQSDDRKTIRNADMDLIVRNPRDATEQIRRLSERQGGFLVSSNIAGGDEASSASLTIRVPAAQFEGTRSEIRKLGLRVESEKLEAQDVTRQYVDQAARLRNLRAQEVQYLGILKQARTVKDTLEVSDKLDDVRGEIETQQAEFDALSKQVETVALAISLRAEADAKVFGLNWRPLYQLKVAARQGLDSMGDYAATMAAFLFYLPTVLLWLATILIGAAVGWRILRWAGKALFVTRAKPATVQA